MFKKKAKVAPKVQLSAEERSVLVKETHWDDKQLTQLFTSYMGISGGQPHVSMERLRDLPETSCVPLFQAVINRVRQDRMAPITFNDFARAMSALSPQATLKDKLDLAFGCFDMDGSARVRTPEVFQLLRMTLGKSMTDEMLQNMVDTLDEKFPSGMSYDDFVNMVDVTDMCKLTLNF